MPAIKNNTIAQKYCSFNKVKTIGTVKIMRKIESAFGREEKSIFNPMKKIINYTEKNLCHH
ncbi:hypothetical protein SPONN_56 [uncultured Candidatus Thioglobus sp.]|nr:hypothetical protein SPONN_56 [uncultured Candidatus Thioglobus sp.]SMM99900.1 hypothetical protein SPONL_968 [uncultured Candidatus Thioglobus sp.]